MIFKGMYVSCGRWERELERNKREGVVTVLVAMVVVVVVGDGGAEMKPPGGGGVKYGFTSPPGPRLFLRARGYVRLHLAYTCKPRIPTSTCVRCWARVTSHAPLSPPLCEEQGGAAVRGEGGCQDSFVRPGLEIQGGVLLLFSLHCHTRRQCFVPPIPRWK